tara:strand:+ start:443 stop:598 length:156 start_codon:yes stop_codon:yes gene_type:complete
MRCLVFLGAVALSGCGVAGAAVARTIPEEYHWIFLAIAVLMGVLSIYIKWR